MAESAGHACLRLGATAWAGHGGALTERALRLERGRRPFALTARVRPAYSKEVSNAPYLAKSAAGQRGAPVTDMMPAINDLDRIVLDSTVLFCSSGQEDFLFTRAL